MGVWGSLWGLHEERTLAPEQFQDTVSCHTDKGIWCSHHITLPLSCGHPSGRRSTFIPLGTCPAQYILSPCFGGASQQCWIIVMITIFYNCGGGEVGPSGSELQVFNWVFPDCLAFGLSGLHWDKFLTSKLCLLSLKSSFFSCFIFGFFLFITAIFW